MELMHILFITDNFPPEVNAPATRTFEHAVEWQRDGCRVTILTTAPNFPTGIVFKNYSNKVWQREMIKGVEIIRVWSFISANRGFFLRILDYFSFMLTSIIASLFIKKIDVVIGTSPQFFTVCSAYIVSRLKKCKFIFELRDLWPESIKALNVLKEGIILTIFEKLELFLYKKADIIISVTKSFKKQLINRGINGSKIHIITNGVNIKKFQIKKKNLDILKKLKLNNSFVCGYIGTHGLAHGLETILKTAEIFKKKKINEGKN